MNEVKFCVLILLSMKVQCILHTKTRYESIRRIFIFLYSISHLVYMAALFFQTTIQENFEAYTHAIFGAIAFSSDTVKFFQCLRKGELMKKMAQDFSHVFDEIENTFELPQDLSTKRFESKMNKFFVCILVGYLSTSIIYNFFPYLYYVIIGQPEGTRPEILLKRYWLPFDVSVSPMFELIYFYEAITIFIGAMYNFLYNCVCFVLIMQITHRLKILQYILKHNQDISKNNINLSGRIRKNTRGEKDVFVRETSHDERYSYLGPHVIHTEGQLVSSTKTHFVKPKINHLKNKGYQVAADTFKETENQCRMYNEMYKNLYIAIQYHQKLLSLCRELESITSIPMLIEVVFSLVIFCTCGFQLTLAESARSKAIIIIAFIFFAIPFFVFCKLSTDLALQSAAVAEAAYKMEWYDAPPTFKSSVCVIIARSQRPVALTAGKFNPVTLNTFISVMQVAYSNYAVLRTINTP